MADAIVVKPHDITIKDVLSFQKLWFRNSPASPGAEFDPESAMLTMQRIADDGICIRRGTGMAGAIFHPFPWNHKYTIASIAFWFFVSPRDIVIFRDICHACFAMGATTVSVASHYPSHVIGRHYAKLGFVPNESQWLCSSSILEFDRLILQ